MAREMVDAHAPAVTGTWKIVIALVQPCATRSTSARLQGELSAPFHRKSRRSLARQLA